MSDQPDSSGQRANPTHANLWHGYSLADIERLAGAAARQAIGRHALDPSDRYEAAWGSIVEHLATADTTPTQREVLAVAYRAINTAANQSRSSRGMPYAWGAHEGSTAGYRRYWELLLRATPSPEGPVVDRRALAQIWPTLTTRQQQVLFALALHDGDHRAAAASLGYTLGSYRNHLSDARTAYRSWWHEHETPSRMWGQSGKQGRRTATQALALRLRARKRQAPA